MNSTGQPDFLWANETITHKGPVVVTRPVILAHEVGNGKFSCEFWSPPDATCQFYAAHIANVIRTLITLYDRDEVCEWLTKELNNPTPLETLGVRPHN